MYGAIVGDMVGSVYERYNTTDYDFPIFKFWGKRHSRFTDDSVLTIATASAVLKAEQTGSDLDSDLFAAEYKEFHKRFPNRGYGRGFNAWVEEPVGVLGESFGNGSAMRVSPIGWMYDDFDDTLDAAEVSAMCSHSHPEGVKGAQAIAGSIFMARNGYDKEAIGKTMAKMFDYDLNATVSELIPESSFAACQASVPPAIQAFVQSSDYEDAIRRAIVMGGDSDTIAAMTGSIAEAYYGGVPAKFRSIAFLLLPISMRKIVAQFRQRYEIP